jgi:hypothetical protein
MRLRDFIRANRPEIDGRINAILFRYAGDGTNRPGVIPDPPPRRNDDERLMWIDNDESLTMWARNEGANV